MKRTVFLVILAVVVVFWAAPARAAYVSGMVSFEDGSIPREVYLYFIDPTGLYVDGLLLKGENSFDYQVDNSQVGLEYKVQVYSPDGLSGWYATFPVVVTVEKSPGVGIITIPLDSYTFSNLSLIGWRTEKGHITVKLTGLVQYNRSDKESQPVDIWLIASGYNRPDSDHPEITFFIERSVKKVTAELGGMYQQTPFEIVYVFPGTPKDYHNVGVRLQLTKCGNWAKPLTALISVDSVYIE